MAEVRSRHACGVRAEEVGHPLIRQIRQLDKLVGALARGR
ncbi:MAG: DUF2200 family protein [Lysobacteraceae bacterium]|nr:MAG: DUF2200 family protein [Xanthomonadaceae bacterium]